MDQNSERIDEFRRAMEALNVTSPPSAADKVYQVLGILLPVVGIVLIFVGYNGAAGTDFTPEAISYLLSGGVLGLALVVLGSALLVRFAMARYLRFWLLRSIFEQRAQTDRIVEAVKGSERTGV